MSRAFTLLESLLCVAIIAALIGLLGPSLSGARSAAKSTVCMSNQRQLATGWTLYANAFADRAMPLAFTSLATVGTGDGIYWWGTDGRHSGRVDPARGFLAPFLDQNQSLGGVFECPAQAPGSYRTQTATNQRTSTYGYNGYYLSPAFTPGWSASIAHRPARRLSSIAIPSALHVFADTLLPMGPAVGNTALLDPPMLFSRSGGGRWSVNLSPTTAFRHGSHADPRAAIAHADTSVRVKAPALRLDVAAARAVVGATTSTPDPGYVPDWKEWTRN